MVRGETAWGTFRLFVLPLVMPGIMASFLICFTISFDEFIISNFLGSGQPILSVYIFGQFRFPAKVPAMLALGTILVGFSILLLTIAEYSRRRGIAKTGGKAVLVNTPGANVERIMFQAGDPSPEAGDKRGEPDTKHPFFQDKRVRQALAMAIGRNIMLSSVSYTHLTLPTSDLV